MTGCRQWLPTSCAIRWLCFWREARPPSIAARSATTTVPIVFTSGDDPVKRDLSIASTGRVAMLPAYTCFVTGLEPKRLELLREVVPQADGDCCTLSTRISPMPIVNCRDLRTAADALRQQIEILQRR